MLLEAKGQPLIALAKSLFVFSAFVQGCKDSKEEELEELPQVKGRVAAEAGERKLLAWEAGGGGWGGGWGGEGVSGAGVVLGAWRFEEEQ